MIDTLLNSNDRPSSANVVTCTGSIDLNAASELRAAMLEAIGSHTNVYLDLSAASAIDLAGLQLICATHRTAEERGVTLQISPQLPDSLMTTVRMAGFSRQATCIAGCNSTCIWSLSRSEKPESHHE